MSTVKWTNPNTNKDYDIGTAGWETNYTAIKSSEIALEAVREFFPGIEAAKFFLREGSAGYGAFCPTYGYWAVGGEGDAPRILSFQ